MVLGGAVLAIPDWCRHFEGLKPGQGGGKDVRGVEAPYETMQLRSDRRDRHSVEWSESRRGVFLLLLAPAADAGQLLT